MKFNKLALAAAVAAAPTAGLAMEPMEDNQLSNVTGQDGLSIGLSTSQTMDVIIEDTDGTSVSAYSTTGSIVISNAGLDTTVATGDLQIDVDAGGNGTNGMLNVVVTIPNNTELTTGDIGVADGDGSGGTTGTSNIIPSTTVTFSNGATLDMELGNEDTAFLEFTGDLGTITFGDAANATDNFEIQDGGDNSTNPNSSISMDELAISGLDMSGTTVDVTTAGLEIVNGSNLNNVDIDITQLSLNGGTDTVGNVYIRGLDMAGDTITVNGK